MQPITLDQDVINYIDTAEKQRLEVSEHFRLGIQHLIQAISLAPKYSIEGVLRSQVYWFSCDHDKYISLGEKSLDKALWRGLVERANLGRYLNQSQISEIQNDIEDNPMPFDKTAALQTLKSMTESQGQILLKGIVDVFSNLSKNYKTNSAFKVNKKLIVNGVLTGYNVKSVQDLRFSYGRNADAFNDFWKYCYLLNGKNPLNIPREERPQSVVESGLWRGEDYFQFEEFSVRCFLNGNIHLFIEKPEILSKINKSIENYFKGMLPFESAGTR